MSSMPAEGGRVIDRCLFIDDVRKPYSGGWDVVRSYKEFVDYIETIGVPKVISFDHDLGFEHYPLGEQNPTERIPYETYKEKTGYDCAKYLVEKGEFPNTALIHSYNIVGAQNIGNLLRPYCTVILDPYKAGLIV